jgi:hypothetical protein
MRSTSPERTRRSSATLTPEISAPYGNPLRGYERPAPSSARSASFGGPRRRARTRSAARRRGSRPARAPPSMGIGTRMPNTVVSDPTTTRPSSSQRSRTGTSAPTYTRRKTSFSESAARSVPESGSSAVGAPRARLRRTSRSKGSRSSATCSARTSPRSAPPSEILHPRTSRPTSPAAGRSLQLDAWLLLEPEPVLDAAGHCTLHKQREEGLRPDQNEDGD